MYEQRPTARGASAVEYAMMVAAITALVVGVVFGLSSVFSAQV